jgi:uncharacterized protein (TIGR02757 family)
MSGFNLKNTLDRFYREYNFRERLLHDPIEFPHRYSDPNDIETAGFIASCFAYGKIGLFKPVIEKILEPGGKRPSRFFADFSIKKDSGYFKGISYRFSREREILCFTYMISEAVKTWGSLKNLFYHYYRPEQEDIRDALCGFVDYFFSVDTTAVYGKNVKPSGLTHLFPSPKKGSACKRMNLFLRWMVRTEDIDMGIWERISPSKLIIPLDTHIARISRCLKLTKKKSSDWKTAKEITESLKALDPEDPLKYDFALCHHGISGLCKGMNHMVHTKEEKAEDICSTCVLKKQVPS